MTKEELEKEAEEYYESKPIHTYVDSLGFFHDLEGIKQAYIASAEPRERRIENMKCCGNCEHATHDSMNGTFCNYYSEWEPADLKCTQWELRR